MLEGYVLPSGNNDSNDGPVNIVGDQRSMARQQEIPTRKEVVAQIEFFQLNQLPEAPGDPSCIVGPAHIAFHYARRV